MSPSVLVAAEQRHAATLGVPGTISLDGTRYRVRFISHRGVRMELDGGLNQMRRISAIVLCSVLPAAQIIDATTGATRTREIIHVETGLTYRIDPDGVQRSPQSIYWLIKASQPVP